MMKILQLRYFQAVCRYNNITRASVELYVSQPAISASIKELEDELGVSLFHRQNNKIALTMEGTYFLKRVDEILADVDLLIMQMKDFGGKKNHFRMGIPPMIGTFLFPPMFKKFREAHPEIEIEMIEYGSLQTRVLVEDESIDLAIAIVEDGMEAKFNIRRVG
ncbi:MAG: LysR family transcriptional regulator [Firmicutes bacterium]|nr:LysR family transcriptional regulator [Bacillota bacterium]